MRCGLFLLQLYYGSSSAPAMLSERGIGVSEKSYQADTATDGCET